MTNEQIIKICNTIRKAIRSPYTPCLISDYEGELEGTGRAVNFVDDYLPVVYEHNHERETITGKHPCTAWAVDVTTVYHGGYHEPDDVDISTTIQGVSFQKAFTHALKLLLEWEVNNALDALATEEEAEAQAQYDKELAEMERDK